MGGEEGPIIPYQRPRRSGSQTLFLSLLMVDEAPMDAPKDWAPYTMGQLVDIVGGYQNSREALGYSMYYYVHNMYGLDTVRILSIEGVAPSEQSLLDESYPLIGYYCAVLRKDTPADAPARLLVDYLLSDEGQRMIARAGYVREADAEP